MSGAHAPSVVYSELSSLCGEEYEAAVKVFAAVYFD